MPTPDTPFKQILYNAIAAPMVKVYPTVASAHAARFAMYNAMRTMRRATPPDPYGDMRDILEFIIRKLPDGKGELRIQRKSTKLVDSLEGWEQDEVRIGKNKITCAEPDIDMQALSAQISREQIKEVNPNDPREAQALRRLEINDWLEQKEQDFGFRYMEALALLKHAGDITLNQFRELLSSHGIN